jgi:hypothetical protein
MNQWNHQEFSHKDIIMGPLILLIMSLVVFVIVFSFRFIEANQSIDKPQIKDMIQYII